MSLLTVDHQLQEGSGTRAEKVAGLATGLGLEFGEALTVQVGAEGGPEAAAREARYRALGQAAERLGARAVLLGHTRAWYQRRSRDVKRSNRIERM